MVSEPSSEPDDAELLDAMRRGSVSAFETLYARHREWILSLAYRFCGNTEDSLDVLQETFAYLLRKLPSLELRVRTRTFLYPVVKHLALDRRRLTRRQAPLEAANDLPALQNEPREDFAETDVGRLLERLPEEQMEVVWLRFVDGLDLKSIAESLGIPLGTVKSRLHAALEALRSRLQ